MDPRGRVVAAALALLATVTGGVKHADKFTTLGAPVIALTHARVLDGSSRPVRDDQTLIIQGGRISAIGRSGAVDIPKGAQIRDLTGKSVLPGLVGMHEPLFYQIEREGSSDLVTTGQAKSEFFIPGLDIENEVTLLSSARMVEVDWHRSIVEALLPLPS